MHILAYSPADAASNDTWTENFAPRPQAWVPERNIGWRLDYVFVEETLRRNLVACRHLPDRTGSDHCPVQVELNVPEPADEADSISRQPTTYHLAGRSAGIGLVV